MLNPNNDRLDYGQILAPPADYSLDFAVGTTYSLDLDALVGANLALGLSEETDSVLLNNPVCLLEALRSTGDKVALFSEGGQIHIPNKVTSLYILLEKIVFTVNTPKHRGISAYPSFHPKFWIIRFKNNIGQFLYRVIILSRNLTFDRSWDVTYYMDGKPSDTRSAKNQPLCDFLQFLLNCLPSDENGKIKAKGIRSLIKELPFVSFEPGEKEFYDYEFIPIGVKKAESGFYQITDKPLFTDTFHEILIISPFLTGSVLRDFNNRNVRSLIEAQKYVLITREMSLGKLKPEDVSLFRIYTMKDAVVDGESSISEGAFEAQKQDIHAKVFMIRKHSDSDLYIGSMNASHNAIHGNIEFMLLLRSKNRYLNIDKLTADLFGSEKEEDNPFQEMTLQNAIIDEDDTKKNSFESIIKAINRSGPKANVIEQTDAMYSVRVYFDTIDTHGFSVVISPLLSKQSAEYNSVILFEEMHITQLSEFYSITVSDGETSIERVLIIPTSGLPEDREKAVITSVISDKEYFYRYIAFLLGDNSILSTVEGNKVFGDGISNQIRQPYQIPALYEKMLQTAANAPEKFKGIEYLMKTISEDGVIPEDFKELYETFKKAVKIRV